MVTVSNANTCLLDLSSWCPHLETVVDDGYKERRLILYARVSGRGKSNHQITQATQTTYSLSGYFREKVVSCIVHSSIKCDVHLHFRCYIVKVDTALE